MPINNPGAAALKSFRKSETRAMADVSGDVAYTGYGFKPSVLIITSCLGDALSWAQIDINLDERCVYKKADTKTFYSGNYSVMIMLSATSAQEAIIKSLDSDGFTLTWAKAGTPAGTGNFTVLALA